MMIRLENLTKYYNRHKKNELAVCNDISISFDNTGLVVILGPSGSGKTTLLNVISGMDDFDSGKLIFDDRTMEKYNHKLWDDIRKNKIGYVYQNYHLLKSLTVYQNIEPILRMQGFSDADIIRNHVDTLISAVGLENYTDRYVKQLSGGEQQRVAFARALANNPTVILADEPTGNLDSKTTIEIMNVIKKISKTRLVIMVTHEHTLSDYYADRVIKLENGKIVDDYKNDTKNSLDLIQEHIITLSNFDKSNIDSEKLNVNLYSNNKSDKLKMDLIERNQTLYIKIDSKKLKRTKYIDDYSEIIIQDKPQENPQSENDFDLEKIYQEHEDSKKSRVFRWRDIFRYALRKVNIFHGGSKIWLLVLFVVGAIIGVSVGLMGEVYNVSPPYEKLDPHYIVVKFDRSMYNDYQDIEKVPGVNQLMLVNRPYEFSISTPDYYEVRGSIDIEAQPVDIKFFDESTLIYGKLPDTYGIVVDKSVADDIIQSASDRGVLDYDDILNSKFKLQASLLDSNISDDTALYFNITGIADGNSKSVWMNEDLIYSLVTPSLVNYKILGDNFKILSGELPSGPRYIMLNDHYPSIINGSGVPDTVGVAYSNYYISGVFQYIKNGYSYNMNYIFIADSTDLIKKRYFQSNYHPSSDFTLLVYATDVKTAERNLKDAGYTISANNFDRNSAIMEKIQENIAFLSIALVGIFMSAVSIYFIMRSSLISRIYEVSVYRAIGISRKEIRKMFFSEILITTTFSSIIGFLAIFLLLTQAQSTVQEISVVNFTWYSVLITILGIYIINIAFGLIPINRLLHKTPSTIMKQSDL